MCTLSWQTAADGYRLWFNRDERRDRPPAAPPAPLRIDGMACLAPRDGAGGTWLLVNARGMSLGLLNHYPGEGADTPAAPRSRGLIPLACAGSASAVEALACCAEMDLAAWRPFLLVAVDTGEAALLTWDGRTPALSPLPNGGGMVTSSSWRPEAVAQARRAAFRRLVGEAPGAAPERLEAFHRHRGAEPAAGIRMARPDACTHSIARIEVSWRERIARFRYEPQTEIQPVPPVTTTHLLLEKPGHA